MFDSWLRWGERESGSVLRKRNGRRQRERKNNDLCPPVCKYKYMYVIEGVEPSHWDQLKNQDQSGI